MCKHLTTKRDLGVAAVFQMIAELKGFVMMGRATHPLTPSADGHDALAGSATALYRLRFRHRSMTGRVY
jgi:hypothetical protein